MKSIIVRAARIPANDLYDLTVHDGVDLESFWLGGDVVRDAVAQGPVAVLALVAEHESEGILRNAEEGAMVLVDGVVMTQDQVREATFRAPDL